MRKQLILLGIVPAALAVLASSPPAAHANAAPASSAVAANASVGASMAAATGRGPLTSLVDGALETLSSSVSRISNPAALRMAFQAYYNFKAAHPEQVRNPLFYFVDYGLGSGTPRGYVFDMRRDRVVDGPFIVAAGRGSSTNAQGVPTSFSNSLNSGATSLGLFLTQSSYSFVGHAGGQPYSSIGLRLVGLSGRFNDEALSRGVVVHGAPYVTSSRAGKSLGCPAMDQPRAHRLIPELANGGLVYLFSPKDADWMRNDPWSGTSLSLG